MSTFFIVFREFVESFLLISILLGFSKKEGLHKEKSILAGGITGVVISLAMALFVFFIFPLIHVRLEEEQIELFEQISMVVSGAALLFVTHIIHPLFSKHAHHKAQNMMEKNKILNASLFFPSLLLVLQEGLEIVLFTTTTAFTTSVVSNIFSLFAGFIAAVGTGFLLYKTYLINHVQKLFKITEIALICYGAYLIFHGGSELVETFFY